MLINKLEVKGQRKRWIHWGHHIHNNKDDDDNVYLVIVIDIDFFFLSTRGFLQYFQLLIRDLCKRLKKLVSLFFVKSNVVVLEQSVERKKEVVEKANTERATNSGRDNLKSNRTLFVACGVSNYKFVHNDTLIPFKY